MLYFLMLSFQSIEFPVVVIIFSLLRNAPEKCSVSLVKEADFCSRNFAVLLKKCFLSSNVSRLRNSFALYREERGHNAFGFLSPYLFPNCFPVF